MHGGFEIVLWVLLAVASITDLLWGKIHNLLTFSFLAAGILVRVYADGLLGGTAGIYAATAALVLFFPLYYFKVLAAGDVKLMAAVGAWTDFNFIIRLGLVSIVVGAAVGLIVLVQKRALRVSVSPRGLTTMPFAPAFLCAFFLIKISEMKGWHLF